MIYRFHSQELHKNMYKIVISLVSLYMGHYTMQYNWHQSENKKHFYLSIYMYVQEQTDKSFQIIIVL